MMNLMHSNRRWKLLLLIITISTNISNHFNLAISIPSSPVSQTCCKNLDATLDFHFPFHELRGGGSSDTDENDEVELSDLEQNHVSDADGIKEVNEEKVVKETSPHKKRSRSKSRSKKRTSSKSTNKTGKMNKTQEMNQPQIPSELRNKAPEPPRKALTLPPPPNAVFRFLLTKGYLGHSLIMISVTLYEFCMRYCPILIDSIQWILIRLRLYDPKASHLSRRRSSFSNIPSSSSSSSSVNVNAQYGAFVDLSHSTRKNRLAQSKQMDILAYQKLKLLGKTVGSMEEVKLRHCSISFMRRHRLGPFKSTDFDTKRGETETTDTDIPDIDEEASMDDETEDDSSSSSLFASKGRKKKKTRKKTKKRGDEYDDESDCDWVIEALSSNSPHRSSVLSEEASINMKTSLVKKLKTKESTRDIDDKSDTDTSAIGGGANVLMKSLQKTITGSGTRILGAYPNDAVPVEEAGSADGVISLARKYGYGDWEHINDDQDYHESDGSDDNEDDIFLKNDNDDSDDWDYLKGDASQEHKKNDSPFQFEISFGGRTSSNKKRTRTSNRSSAKTKTRESTRASNNEHDFNPIDLMTESNSDVQNVVSTPPKRKRRKRITTTTRSRNIVKKSLSRPVKERLDILATQKLAAKKLSENRNNLRNERQTSYASNSFPNRRNPTKSSIGRTLAAKMDEVGAKAVKQSPISRVKPVSPMQRSSELRKRLEKEKKKNE